MVSWFDLYLKLCTMKNYIYILSVAILILSGCATQQQYGSAVYADDLYYTPSDKPISVAENYSALPKPDKMIKKADNKAYSSLKKEYNNSSRAKQQEDLRDFSQIQEEYTSLLTDDSVEEVDSLLYYDDETGYWVNEFQGSEMDRNYAERLARFHGPFRGIPYWSPLYQDVIFGSGFDYNVYIDGNYAIVVPEWNNPYYWDWRYGRGFHRGFYGGFYSGFGYSSWYGMGYPYYSAWGYPYFGMGFGWAHGWGYGGYYHPHYHHHWPHYGNNSYAANRRPRNTYTGTSYNSSRQAALSKSTATSSRGAYSTSSRSNNISSGSSRAAVQSRTNGSRSTRASYVPNNTKSTSVSSGTSTRSSRSAYTPTYNKSSQYKTTTRSSYNRANRTPNSAPARSSGSSYGSRNSSRSSVSGTSTKSSTYNRSSNRSSTSRSYNTGSSRSRSSNYNSSSAPSRSSSSPAYKSSSGSSRSSSGVSSGSRSRSSSGSSRSSSGSSSRSSRGSR
ncbi:hypothetical protein SAMN06265379_101641 [Saccharicrinis carchari]|uniref:RING-type E3 ubiquitin transferase n=2 Tax=Saccharicrinis carchari TaxID=1168039 RepID=A0A521B335_SACCC|nr:hypothetical protein SAMN06265379_101641 [Saccharicrinis carchari]